MRKEEHLLDVLMYLFENHINDTLQVANSAEYVNEDMISAGFNHRQINEAVQWFDQLYDLLQNIGKYPDFSITGMRIFSQEETNKITSRARGFLQDLSRKGLIDATLREIIIDRAMALDESYVSVSELKWVSLMVLYNQLSHSEELHFLEEIILSEKDIVRH